MTTPYAALLDDLGAETAALRALVAELPADGWATPTPAEGWTIADQIGHLAYFDDITVVAITDYDGFRRRAAADRALGPNFVDVVAARLRGHPPAELLGWWDRARAALLSAYREAEPGTRTPWYGPEMSVMSSATARLMETWAHGVDVAEALGQAPSNTARLRHIVHLGVRTAGFSFTQHGREVPAVPFYVELTDADGTVLRHGDPDAFDAVRGSALDFALVVTQRRSVGTTNLEVEGRVAAEWMRVAQAFAGPPTEARGR